MNADMYSKRGNNSAGHLAVYKVIFKYQWDMLALGHNIYKEPEVLQTNTCLSTKMYVFEQAYNALSATFKTVKIIYVNLL